MIIIEMSHQDKNNGLCFRNHNIDLTKIEWGMNKGEVKRLVDYKNYRENKDVIGYTVDDGLEFDGNSYDTVLLFFFNSNKLFKISILLDVVFDDGAIGVYYQTIKEILCKIYGPASQKNDPGKMHTCWATDCSKITLIMSEEYNTLKKELSIFGVRRRLSADFYDSPPDKLIRIILEKKQMLEIRRFVETR